MHRTAPLANSLDLDDDGDDVDLIKALEESFGVCFGNETASWFTVGDIHQALMSRLSLTNDQGKCSTSMAFYEVRAAIKRMGVDAKLTPSTQLASLTGLPPKVLYATIARDLDIASPRFSPSIIGILGIVATAVGLLGSIFFVANRQWATLLLVPAGLIALLFDTGAYGRKTMGDLTREIARRNFRRFSDRGADNRPEAVWRAMLSIIAEISLTDPQAIGPSTRLLAKQAA